MEEEEQEEEEAGEQVLLRRLSLPSETQHMTQEHINEENTKYTVIAVKTVVKHEQHTVHVHRQAYRCVCA